MPFETKDQSAPLSPTRDLALSHSDEEKGSSRRPSESRFTLQKILRYGRVEARGIEPVPFDDRTSTRYYNIFTIWTSINSNILGYVLVS